MVCHLDLGYDLLEQMVIPPPGPVKRPAEPWEIWTDSGAPKRVVGPREFVHAFSTLINVPLQLGFRLRGAWEDGVEPCPGTPGSWAHFTAVCPPYLVFWWQRGESVRR
jgi:hypothetical protein